MARRTPICVRLSKEFEALLGGVGKNHSAVIRALLLIGADAVGLDCSKVESDVLQALAYDVPEAVHRRLRTLHDGRSRAGSPVSAHAAHTLHTVPPTVTPVEHHRADDTNPAYGIGPSMDMLDEDDPLTAVGFDFDS